MHVGRHQPLEMGPLGGLALTTVRRSGDLRAGALAWGFFCGESLLQLVIPLLLLAGERLNRQKE